MKWWENTTNWCFSRNRTLRQATPSNPAVLQDSIEKIVAMRDLIKKES